MVAADFHLLSGVFSSFAEANQGEIVSVAHFRCNATHKCVILNTGRPYRVKTKKFKGKCLVLFEHTEVVSTQNLHTDQGKWGVMIGRRRRWNFSKEIEKCYSQYR